MKKDTYLVNEACQLLYVHFWIRYLWYFEDNSLSLLSWFSQAMAADFWSYPVLLGQLWDLLSFFPFIDTCWHTDSYHSLVYKWTVIPLFYIFKFTCWKFKVRRLLWRLKAELCKLARIKDYDCFVNNLTVAELVFGIFIWYTIQNYNQCQPLWEAFSLLSEGFCPLKEAKDLKL